MNFRLFSLVSLVFFAFACGQPDKGQTVILKNELSTPVSEFVFEVNLDEAMQSIVSEFNEGLIVLDGDNEIPYQFISKNGEPVALLLMADWLPSEEKVITLKAGQPTVFPAKTQAEMSIKEGGEWVWLTKNNGNEQYEYKGGTWKNVSSIGVDEKHTDHSFDIRYEGPGWESDKIGYRFYLDWRNAVDIFGKTVDTLVLQNIGLDGFDSYHEMCDWGVDVLKVGGSLGMGSIGHWADETANRVAKTDSLYSEVSYSGLLESKITSKYIGWEHESGKTDLTSEISIRAGSYLTKNKLTSSNSIDNICTGIVKHKNTTVLKSTEISGDWAYLATFGAQTLQNDELGMCVFYKKDDLIELTEDAKNHVVVLKPDNNQVSYYFGAAWEKDASQMDSIEKFETFLNKQLALFNAGMIK